MGQFFVLNTNDHCFLCFTRVTRPKTAWKYEDQDPLQADPSVGNVFSFHRIGQYLKLNLSKVVAATKASVPSTSTSASSILEEAPLELNGVLCEKCAKLNETFSNQILELEAIKMKLQCSLRSLCDAILGMDKNQDRSLALEQFREEMMRRPDTLAQFEAVEQLRKQTLERCSQKLRTSSVQNMSDPAVESIMDIKVELLPDEEDASDLKETDDLNESKSNSSLVEGDICHLTVKDPLAHLSSSSHDQKIDRNVDKTMPRIKQYRTILPKTIKVEKKEQPSPLEIPLPVSKRPNKAKVLPNSRDTKTHDCSLCGKKFARIGYLTIHQKTVHLQLRNFLCNVCGRAFSQKGSLNRHRRVVHFSNFSKALKTMKPSDVIDLDPLSHPTLTSTVPEAVADAGNSHPTVSEFHSERDDKPVSSFNPETGNHKCSFCSKEFSKYTLLTSHYKTVHLKRRFECTVCGQEFRQRYSFTRHYKKVHMGV